MAELEVSDKELAEAIGASKPSAQTYRKILSKLKLIETEEPRHYKIKEIAITRAKY